MFCVPIKCVQTRIFNNEFTSGMMVMPIWNQRNSKLTDSMRRFRHCISIYSIVVVVVQSNANPRLNYKHSNNRSLGTASCIIAMYVDHTDGDDDDDRSCGTCIHSFECAYVRMFVRHRHRHFGDEMDLMPLIIVQTLENGANVCMGAVLGNFRWTECVYTQCGENDTSAQVLFLSGWQIVRVTLCGIPATTRSSTASTRMSKLNDVVHYQLNGNSNHRFTSCQHHQHQHVNTPPTFPSVVFNSSMHRP